jgi:hypothetical protein
MSRREKANLRMLMIPSLQQVVALTNKMVKKPQKRPSLKRPSRKKTIPRLPIMIQSHQKVLALPNKMVKRSRGKKATLKRLSWS